MSPLPFLFFLLLSCLAPITTAVLTATSTHTRLTLSNSHLSASLNKSTGAIDNLSLFGQDLLGSTSPNPSDASGSDNSGRGPYLDCYCVPEGFYTPGSIAPQYQLLQGVDSTNTSWAGIVMSETYPSTNQTLSQFWFLRDGESGLHTFSRLTYWNASQPVLRNLQEFRTLFRPNTRLWTHLSTNKRLHAPLPYHNPATGDVADAVVVQDATWYLPNRSDPYVLGASDYFTKYTFSDTWRDHKVHGLFSDGSTSDDGSTFGAWFVMNTIDTYHGGATHSDLTVDGIVYNYMVSNHHGNQVPNITDGFERTYGPGYYHFNKGAAGGSLEELRSDAEQYADAAWNSEFYDSIAHVVPGYVATSGRGGWKGKIELPKGAGRPVAMLTESGRNWQDNVFDPDAYQYWAEVDGATGEVSMGRVKGGRYRLTVYADGVFGQLEMDDIVVLAGETSTAEVRWTAESAGAELWRIGRPDKSSGEFKHGARADAAHATHAEEYRMYWAVYDFIDDFPAGVTFDVATDNVATDWNYVHWSVFGGEANAIRPAPSHGHASVNNWSVLFDVSARQLQPRRQATLTVQLAAAKTAAGNTDDFNTTQPYSDLALGVHVNGRDVDAWTIPHHQSSSCAVRSAVLCYNIAHHFVFHADLLHAGRNALVLSLPFNATDDESALLPASVYVQYDALRLELR